LLKTEHRIARLTETRAYKQDMWQSDVQTSRTSSSAG